MSTGNQIATALHVLREAWPNMVPDLRSVGGEPTSGTRDAPTPVPIPIVSLRREVDACVTSWARLVVEERDLRTGTKAGDVEGLAGFLLIHADWLGQHEAGPDAAAELERWAIQCKDVATGRKVRVISLGRCFEHDTSDLGERVPCTGTLTARITVDDPKPSKMTCDVDPAHSWDAWQWPVIGHRLGKINPVGAAALVKRLS